MIKHPRKLDMKVLDHCKQMLEKKVMSSLGTGSQEIDQERHATRATEPRKSQKDSRTTRKKELKGTKRSNSKIAKFGGKEKLS